MNTPIELWPADRFDINYRQPLPNLGQRLIGPTAGSFRVFIRNDLAGPWTDESDYYLRGLASIEKPALIYEVEGHDVQIFILEEEAEAFEAVRKNRLQCLEAGDVHGGLGSDSLALPEDVVYNLDQLPHTDYSRKFLLLNRCNWQDEWTSQLRGETFISASAQTIAGDVIFFKAHNNCFFRINLTHEWSHFLQKPTSAFDAPNRHPEEWSAFECAVDIEWRLWMPPDSEYALKAYNEHWAVIGQEFLHWLGRYSVDVTKNAPLRTFFWSRAFALELREIPVHRRPVCFNHLLARALLSERTVREYAERELDDIKNGKGTVYEAHAKAGTVERLLAMVKEVEGYLEAELEHSFLESLFASEFATILSADSLICGPPPQTQEPHVGKAA
jgi:hypothetical protein